MILLTDDTVGESVGLLRIDGSLGYRPWRGFIDVADARLSAFAVPVKMAIEAFTLDNAIGARFFPVPTGRFLQGCLCADGVRCVLVSGRPRLVSTSLPATD